MTDSWWLAAQHGETSSGQGTINALFHACSNTGSTKSAPSGSRLFLTRSVTR